MRFRSTNQGQGARTAAPIYGYFMQQVYKDANIGLSTTDFEKPKGFDDSMFSCAGADDYLPPAADEGEEGETTTDGVELPSL